MDEADKKNLITAALTLGFTVSDHNELKCTHDQLFQLCSIIAASTVEQLEEVVK